MVIFEQVEYLSIHHPDAAAFLRAEAQLCPMKLGGLLGSFKMPSNLTSTELIRSFSG